MNNYDRDKITEQNLVDLNEAIAARKDAELNYFKEFA